MAILKNAIDYKLYKDADIKDKTENVKILGDITLMDFLPLSFKEGLDVISKHRYFHKYPVFW